MKVFNIFSLSIHPNSTKHCTGIIHTVRNQLKVNNLEDNERVEFVKIKCQSVEDLVGGASEGVETDSLQLSKLLFRYFMYDLQYTKRKNSSQ